jgi:hypothetical protein
MVLESLDYSTFALLPKAANGKDGMIVESTSAKLSIIRNKWTELKPTAKEYVPPSTDHPVSCPSSVGGNFSYWPEPPPGFGHMPHASFDLDAYAGMLQSVEEVDEDQVKAELADLMINENGDVVIVSENTSSADDSDCANLADFQSDFSSSNCSSNPSPVLSPSVASSCPKPLDETEFPSLSSVPDNFECSTPARKKTLKKTWSDVATAITTDSNSVSDDSKSDVASTTSRSSRKTKMFNYSSSGSRFTPFPTPNITPSNHSTPNITPSHSNQNSPPMTPTLAPLPAPLSTRSSHNPAAPNTPCFGLGENVLDDQPSELSMDDKQHLRSLHNLARVGGYDDFEKQFLQWLSSRSKSYATDSVILEEESAHILRHLDLDN